MELLDTILKWVGRPKKSENPGQQLFPADKRPTVDNLAETIPARKAAAQEALSPIYSALLNIASIPMSAGASLATYAGDVDAAIRRGGNPRLNLTHETTLNSILGLLSGRSSITNPSIAISADNVAPYRGLHESAASLILNPAARHYFDPAKNSVAQLRNRDTYTTLHKDVLPVDFRTPFPESLSLTEGVASRDIKDYLRANSPIQDTQHMLSVLGSPEFRSLSQLERSRYGERILDRTKGLSEAATKKVLEADYSDIMDALNNSSTKLLDAQLTVDMLRRSAKAGNKDSQKFFDVVGSTVSDYAELKLPGELPLGPNTVSAIMMSPFAEATVRRPVVSLAEKKGIRAGTASELMPADMKSTYDDLALASLERIKKGLDIPNSYYSALERMMLKESTGKEGESMAKQFMQESSKYAADVSSILTVRDLDAILKGTQ